MLHEYALINRRFRKCQGTSRVRYEKSKEIDGSLTYASELYRLKTYFENYLGVRILMNIEKVNLTDTEMRVSLIISDSEVQRKFSVEPYLKFIVLNNKQSRKNRRDIIPEKIFREKTKSYNNYLISSERKAHIKI